jgi:hypothetical protein
MTQLPAKIWASIVFALVCLLGLCFAARRQTQPQSEADIAEVVFRRLLDMPDLSHSPNGDGVCISDERHRFDSRFLKRFQAFPGLRLAQSRPQPKASTETNQRRCEITISVGEIRWLNPSEVAVSGGYYCGMLCGYWADFELRRSGWGWHVVTSYDKIISQARLPNDSEFVVLKFRNIRLGRST